MITLYDRGEWRVVTPVEKTIPGILLIVGIDGFDESTDIDFLTACLVENVDIWIWALDIDESKDWKVLARVFYTREDADAAIYSEDSDDTTETSG